jgi:hypothetical protein
MESKRFISISLEIKLPLLDFIADRRRIKSSGIGEVTT